MANLHMYFDFISHANHFVHVHAYLENSKPQNPNVLDSGVQRQLPIPSKVVSIPPTPTPINMLAMKRIKKQDKLNNKASQNRDAELNNDLEDNDANGHKKKKIRY